MAVPLLHSFVGCHILFPVVFAVDIGAVAGVAAGIVLRIRIRFDLALNLMMILYLVGCCWHLLHRQISSCELSFRLRFSFDIHLHISLHPSESFLYSY